MFKLLKGGQCFNLESIDKKDILTAYNKICKIEDNIDTDGLWDMEIIDCNGMIVCPAFIDQHVHITGGGGEQGPISRIPELMLRDVICAGVSTVVGVLGFDSVTRSIGGLLAKARALELEGITTYIYTGSYAVPTATLTGKPISDLTLVDKVIGIGEIAISDYRSTCPSEQQLKELAWEARMGGMLGGKAGVLHIHVGDGKEGLNPLIQLVENSDFPVEMFVPTHMNRNKSLFHQGVEYILKGGHIDLTAGEKTGKGYSVPDALEILIKDGVDIEKVTVSSDGNGSIPASDGNGEIGRVDQLFKDIQSCVVEKKLDIGTVLKVVTSNVAKLLKLYPTKGALACGSDADILVLNREDFSIQHMLINGAVCTKNKEIIKKGKYEK